MSTQTVVATTLPHWVLSARDARMRGRHRAARVRQVGSADCGPTRLAMPACLLAGRDDLATPLRVAAGERGAPTSFADRIDIADEVLQLRLSVYAASVADIEAADCPMTLHWERDHFVVLARLHVGQFDVLDPARGPRVLSSSEFAVGFAGTFACAAPLGSTVCWPRVRSVAMCLPL